MVRAIHDASESFVPPRDARWNVAISSPGEELICHNDLAPWNLIIGDRWTFIDWDAACQRWSKSEPFRGLKSEPR
ncbi:phosphotransferase, partial [Arthrobacter sp. efr-133-R2A-63]|uniref:phosphotransferase n=1 Tax=Arthrobacter sp. efr-133-R2A-63 TaxID=3040278 RepID=UPI00330762E3